MISCRGNRKKLSEKIAVKKERQNSFLQITALNADGSK
jgi:hypothetical protein